MMYLEDYMQMIEDMPAEFKDALMSIRELDLSVQNAMDKKAKEIRAFFRDARKVKLHERDLAFDSLMQDCKEILKDAAEKVNIAEGLEEVVLKSVAQLDREIAKCKEYLEAEHPGIAAAIEERVAQSEPPPFAEVGSKNAEKRRKRPTKDRKKSSISTSSFDEEPAVQPSAAIAPIANDKVPENVDEQPADRQDVSAPVLPVIAETIYDPTPYCVCNQVAYGDMIACDNPQCTQEWFHYTCMKLTKEPEGKWYCPTCVGASMP